LGLAMMRRNVFVVLRWSVAFPLRRFRPWLVEKRRWRVPPPKKMNSRRVIQHPTTCVKAVRLKNVSFFRDFDGRGAHWLVKLLVLGFGWHQTQARALFIRQASRLKSVDAVFPHGFLADVPL